MTIIAPRRSLTALVVVMLVGLLLIPAVSAEVLTDEGSNYEYFNLEEASTKRI